MTLFCNFRSFTSLAANLQLCLLIILWFYRNLIIAFFSSNFFLKSEIFVVNHRFRPNKKSEWNSYFFCSSFFFLLWYLAWDIRLLIKMFDAHIFEDKKIRNFSVRIIWEWLQKTQRTANNNLQPLVRLKNNKFKTFLCIVTSFKYRNWVKEITNNERKN